MKKILIVSANYYMFIASQMYNEAKKALDNSKNLTGRKQNIKYKLIHVPGVFEIPVVISKNVKKYDGFIALGCVIKGETPHFDFISSATTQAIMNLSVDSKKPIGNGIITCLNKKQAEARSKKGREAAQAVISVLSN
jgi:6,7-dimethyl-8-ribityllumazine synthase|tara:strand:- start:411 stop:821 length:411 start_codon:yes stop_codon:yes gene_type:complete